MYDNLLENKKILLLPAVMSFIIALLLLYKYSYPISWDVYYHMHMIDLYMKNGLVFWDYSTVAPKGRLIMYPPLFHMIFAAISSFTKINYIALCLYAQPIFSFILIYLITFTAYKLFDNTFTGLMAGFLSMLSFVTFNRSVICTPATIAIALSLIVCLYYYEGLNENNLRKILYSSIALAIIVNLHMATSIITIGVLGLYTFIQLIRRKQINIKYILVFLALFIIIAMPWWIYIACNYTLVFNSIAGSNMRITEFLAKYYGILPTLFTIIGYYALYKKRDEKSIFLCIWTLSILILSQVYLIGIQTVSIRILEVAAYPLIFVAAIGFTYLYEKINKNNLKRIFVVVIILLSVLSSIAYVDSYTPDLMVESDINTTVLPDEYHLLFDPVGSTLKVSIISDRYGSAPLAYDRYDMAEYIKKLNDTGIIVSEDAIMDTIIVSNSNSSVVYGGFTESIPEYVVDPVHIVENHSTTNELKSLNIHYLLLKKNTPIPIYAKLEYENSNYKICKITDEYR